MSKRPERVNTLQIQHTDTTGIPAGVEGPWGHQEGLDSHYDSDIREVSASTPKIVASLHFPPSISMGLGPPAVQIQATGTFWAWMLPWRTSGAPAG